MSEDVSVERLSVGEAAQVLGVTRDAIHKRISRGSIQHEKGEDGRFYVYVDTSTKGLDSFTYTSIDKSIDKSKVESLERFIANQEDRISFLERELERRGDEAERLHQIVAGLTRTTAELSTRLPELEAPASPEPRDAPESAGEEPERAEPRSSTGGPQAGYERPRDTAEFPRRGSLTRPWWRRVFGG